MPKFRLQFEMRGPPGDAPLEAGDLHHRGVTGREGAACDVARPRVHDDEGDRPARHFLEDAPDRLLARPTGVLVGEKVVDRILKFLISRHGVRIEKRPLVFCQAGWRPSRRKRRHLILCHVLNQKRKKMTRKRKITSAVMPYLPQFSVSDAIVSE